jgi:four helix bundle protein
MGGCTVAAFGFEQLTVWQKAIEFADLICDVTESLPRAERFGLTSQLRRAAVSVSSNLAEGSGRGSKKDFSRFVEIAFGSVCEVVSQTHLAK